MAAPKLGTLSAVDKTAFLNTAKNLGLNPYELGGLIHLESGFRPNIWGGAGGQYRGLIQFGPGARQEVGLPSGDMTIAQQLPYVEKYFKQRGYKPGMGIEKAYATVLGGNPNANIYSKDAFGTSVSSAVPKMKAGGSLYNEAIKTLGDIGDLSTTQTTQTPAKPAQSTQSTQLPQRQVPINIFIGTGAGDQPSASDFLSTYKKLLIPDIATQGQIKAPTFNPLDLMSALNQTQKYG